MRYVAFTLFCCTVLMAVGASAQTIQQIKADPGNNNPPPTGSILDLSGTPIPGGNGTYQQYTVSFVAGLSSTAITFAFRDDPAFISFVNASVTDLTNSEVNLLVDGDFSGGISGWTYANTYGATFGGIPESGSTFCYTQSYCWYDGAVQAYDAISQTIPTIVGHTYQITFLVADNSGLPNFSDLSTNGDTTDTGGNGINVTVYAQGGLPSSSKQTGQPMNPDNPANLSQPFVFNTTPEQHVEIDFDYNPAFNIPGDLTIVNNTIPTVSDQGITHATYQQMVAGTSLAMTDCFTAPGQGTDANGNSLCAQLTITCTNDNSSTPAGDNCPQSTQRNLYWAQQLDTPGTGFIIPNGSAPSMPMGSDDWAPNHCTLVGPEAGKLCPQSTLTQFALTAADFTLKPGGTGTTTNSSLVAGCCQVEWNTAPSIPAWSNSTTVPVSFTAFPPNPASPTNNWVAAPNQAITWGEENLGATPDTAFPVPGDTSMTNPITCPSAWPLPGTVPPPFTAGGTVSVPGAGVYEVHFFSTACDNQEELAFPGTINTGSPNNVAAFKTASFGVDQTAPTITTPVLNGGVGNNTFTLGSSVTASFACTDDLSGLAGCGKSALPLPKNYGSAQQPPTSGPPTGPLNQAVSGYPVPTSTFGKNTLTVYATDLGGNQSSASLVYEVGYCIVSTDKAGNIGFTAPVLNPGSGLPNINAASVNQAIPLKVTVTDCNGHAITNLALAPAGTVVLSAANANICAIDVPDNSIILSAAGKSGWQNLGGGAYQFNWKPLPPKGACLSFSLNLGDGIQHKAYFKFK